MPTDFESQLQSVLPIAYRMARNLANSAEDAEDLLQDTSIQAFRRFETFERDSNFRAWFLKILLRVHLNRAREKARRPAMENCDFEDEIEQNYLYHHAQETFGGDPAKVLLQRLTSEDIRLAMAKLPIEFRSCAALYFLNEMSYEAIAQTLDCPLNTVRSRLHRARKMLQRELWMLSGDGHSEENLKTIFPSEQEQNLPTKTKFSALKFVPSFLQFNFNRSFA